MARQTIPDKETLKYFGGLCSIALTRKTGTRVDVELSPFILPAYITKSAIFGANIHAVGEESTTQIPSQLIFKRYLPGVRGMTDTRDRTNDEFRIERTVLGLDLGLETNEAKIRIYPQIYSGGISQCERDMIIIREYVTGRNLEEMIKEQKNSGGVKWVSPPPFSSLSDTLYPIALLHVESDAIAMALKERGLLEHGTPQEAKPDEIAQRSAVKSSVYISKLLKGTGRRIKKKDAGRLQEYFYKIDKRFVSTKSLLRIINGELDVFPHHIIVPPSYYAPKRLLDAGSIEVGGLARDIAVYSAPQLSDFWNDPDDMLRTVCLTYTDIIRQLESSLMYPTSTWDEDTLNLGILFASFIGNYRKAAAVVHYKIGEDYPIEEEAGLFLSNGRRYLDAFIRNSDGKDRYRARTIWNVLDKCGLMGEYKLTAPKKNHKNCYLSTLGGEWRTRNKDLNLKS